MHVMRVSQALVLGFVAFLGTSIGVAGATEAPLAPVGQGQHVMPAPKDAPRVVLPLRQGNDPLVWIQQRVQESDGHERDDFGNAAAISGETALIGASGAQVGNNAAEGAVYVYTQSNGMWVKSAELTPNDGTAYDNFGKSVALDGSTAVVGMPSATVGGTIQGAVYVFTESNGAWTQIAKLSAGGQYALFGSSVSISGNEILVGAMGATVGDNNGQGAAYIFTNSNGTWNQTAMLISKDGAASDNFGDSVSIDGNTAIVGAQRAAVQGNSAQGAAYVFTKSGGNWKQTAKLAVSGGHTYDAFGASVALNGSNALIGSPGATINGNPSQGAAYLFHRSSGAWMQVSAFTDPDGSAYDSYAQHVALHGSYAVVGNNNKTVGPYEFRGAVWVYSNSGGTWGLSQELVATDGGTSDNLGASVAIGGNTILAGAPLATIDGNGNQGKSYFYTLADLGLAISAPESVHPSDSYTSQVIATNEGSAASPQISIIAPVPAAASYLSAAATQGDCSEADNRVVCDFGSIPGNAGTAKANIKLKVTHIAPGVVQNTASVVAQATPPLSASAATQIVGYNPPVASDGTLSVMAGETGHGTLEAQDPNGKPLKFIIVVEPSNGKLTLDDVNKGTYTYTPDDKYSGNDSFAFKVNDGEVDSNVATVKITVEKKKSSSGGGGGTGLFGLFSFMLLIALVALKRRRRSYLDA